jgi:hypothetical protein
MKDKPEESKNQTNSENETSEEFRNFENFSKRMGSLTRKELDTIFEKEKKLKKKRKTPRK